MLYFLLQVELLHKASKQKFVTEMNAHIGIWRSMQTYPVLVSEIFFNQILIHFRARNLCEIRIHWPFYICI